MSFVAIDQLNKNLEQQTNLYSELRQLAELKQEALIRNNLPELEAIIIREEQLLLETERLERERMGWSEQCCRDMGKGSEDLTFAELAENYPELQDARRNLENVIIELRNIHETNTQLLNQALKIVNFTAHLFTQQEGTTYTRPGGRDTGTVLINILDKKV